MAERTEYDMTPAESALLRAATKDAMAAAGALGGSLGGDAFGARGGAAGGRFGARLTRPRWAATVVELSRDPEAVREQARTQIAAKAVDRICDAVTRHAP